MCINKIVAYKSNFTCLQVIEIKNTSKNVAKVTLSENLPLSNEESLKVILFNSTKKAFQNCFQFKLKKKVKLIEPTLKNNTIVKLNKSNNLEFVLNIPASKSEEITIKYTIDHPSDKETEFY